MARKSEAATSPMSLWKISNLKYLENPYPMVSLRIPGLHHESFDRDWNPLLTTVMKTTAMARFSVENKLIPSSRDQEKTEEKYFLDWPHITEKHLTFTTSSEFVMSRALYNQSIPKWPIDMKFILGSVGNSSIAKCCEFYACDDNQAGSSAEIPLWKNTTQFVVVDKVTRKTVKLPDWYRDKYKDKGCMEQGLILKPFKRPVVTFAQPSVVEWSDTDAYRHSNWTTYVRWAYNTLQAALLLQSTNGSSNYSPYRRGPAAQSDDSLKLRARAALRGITEDIVIQGVQRMQLNYLRECLQGDYVETHLWQDDSGEKEVVYFSVVKDGADVCQIKMWFFKPLAAL